MTIELYNDGYADGREAAERVSQAINCGNMFATRETIDEAFAYVDAVCNSLSAADKVAVITAVAVLCNTIKDQLN